MALTGKSQDKKANFMSGWNHGKSLLHSNFQPYRLSEGSVGYHVPESIVCGLVCSYMCGGVLLSNLGTHNVGMEITYGFAYQTFRYDEGRRLCAKPPYDTQV